MRYFLLTIIVFLTTSLATAEPLNREQLARLEPITLIELQMPRVKEPATTNNKHAAIKRPRPLQIASTKKIGQSLDSLTNWQTIDKLAILRLKLFVNDAKHLNLGLDNVIFPDSGRLYLLDGATEQPLKSYVAEDINNQQIWTPQLTNNSLIIELQVLERDIDLISISLRQVGIGEKDFSSDSWLKSGSCNIDIACPEGVNWRDVSRAVTRYSISDANGTYACTGTLVNTDRHDQRPIILTAAHCLVAESTAASMIFYWNYETSMCGAEPDGNLSQTSMGATFIARGEGIERRSDFALVELLEPPPAEYAVFFSGWNAVDQMAENVVSIHHPGGDEKRISIDSDPLLITLYGEDPSTDAAQFYRIIAWDAGTTEGGSSGAGIWNQNKQLIGTLSGGDASCAALEASDWYGRMANHWSSAGDHPLVNTSTTLAPATGTRQVTGLDSCSGAAIELTSNNVSPAVNQTFNLSATLTGGAAPFQLAWDFDNDGLVDANGEAPSHLYVNPGSYQVYLKVNDANQCQTSAQLTILVPDANEDYLSDGLKPESLTTPTTANASWVITDGTASEGTYSLRAEIINENETAAIQTTETYSDGTLSFSYRVSSEAGFDSLSFFIDGVEQLTADGEVDWTDVSYAISAGERTLRWEYSKDASASEGVDTAWIDDVKFTATPPPTPTPTPMPRPNSGGGGAVSWYLLLLLLMGNWMVRRRL